MSDRARLLAAFLALAVLAVGCVHGGRAPMSRGPALSSVDVVPKRSLFRVRFEGPRESGSMRLAVYRAAGDRFQIRASDTFGRSLWALSIDAGRSRIVDHRSRRYCESSDEVHMPAVALAPLPVGGLPDMLSGRLPVVPASGESAGSGEFRDREGRRWTVDRAEGNLQSWTLWEGGEPSLWWRRLEKGGVLSHRTGSQFRWRLSAAEPLTEALKELEAPSDYRSVDCSLLTASEPGSDRP